LESYKRGNALLGIYIHNVVDLDRKTDIKGKNPFDNFVVKNNSGQINLSQLCETYDWVNDDGYNNLGKWIEAAVKERQNWSDGELIELKSVRQAIPNTNATFASSKVNEDIKPQAPWSY
jgi:hypothetical protein